MRTAKRLYLLVPLTITVCVVAVTAAGAASAPLTVASGTVGNTSATFESIRQAGGNVIIELTAEAAYTGTFEGTSTIKGTLIGHADGSASFHDIEIFTGTVNGVPGTVTFSLNGVNDSTLAVHATATILSATGELAGLHGVLHEVQTVILPAGPVGTYTGLIG